MSLPQLPEILPLRPYLREMVWGGRRLGELYGKRLPADKSIGEAFELSALAGRDSTIASGVLEGRGLADVLGDYGPDLVGDAVIARYGDAFPLLIKLIDAQDDLSIQVHPDDVYARAHALGTYGKTEAWVILPSDAGRIALGLEDGVSAEDFSAAIAAGEAEQVVHFESVSAGDVVYLPAGTVHALCRGVVIYEVQQSSDITFRLYDYDRDGLDGGKRELHVEQGLAVTDFSLRPQVQKLQQKLAQKLKPYDGSTTVLDTDYFRLDVIDGEIEVDTQFTFAAVTATAGHVTLSGDKQECVLGPGDTAMIPAGQNVRVCPAPEVGRCLIATPTT